MKAYRNSPAALNEGATCGLHSNSDTNLRCTCLHTNRCTQSNHLTSVKPIWIYFTSICKALFSSDIMLHSPERQHCLGGGKLRLHTPPPVKCQGKERWYCPVNILNTHPHFVFLRVQSGKPAESCFGPVTYISILPLGDNQSLCALNQFTLSLIVQGQSAEMWFVLLSVVLSGFLDSGKGKRVLTGELIRVPRNVARLHSLWPLTVTNTAASCFCAAVLSLSGC